ncbi:MAG: hypothetical protein CEE41_05300 [Hadesarchaea archaeon B3_Hades]|nr:MAG: hypothetical protein CEE41_05300 [Hadesarchaea archaeon B3_Hades]
MKILLIAFAISVLFCVFFVPPMIRAYARTRADQIIYGHRPGTEKLINKCIAILSWSNNWITNRTDTDNHRINRLRNMLDEMEKPHD